MKISSASKKVLASALSAAMVVAFAPTVAFGAIADDTQVTVNFDLNGGAIKDDSGLSSIPAAKGTVSSGKLAVTVSAATNYAALDAGSNAIKKGEATFAGWFYDVDGDGIYKSGTDVAYSKTNGIDVTGDEISGTSITLKARYNEPSLDETTDTGAEIFAVNTSASADADKIGAPTVKVDNLEVNKAYVATLTLPGGDKLTSGVVAAAAGTGQVFTFATLTNAQKKSVVAGKYVMTVSKVGGEAVLTKEFKVVKVTLSAGAGYRTFVPGATTDYLVTEGTTYSQFGTLTLPTEGAAGSYAFAGYYVGNKKVSQADGTAVSSLSTEADQIKEDTELVAHYANPQVADASIAITDQAKGQGTLTFNVKNIVAAGDTAEYSATVSGPNGFSKTFKLTTDKNKKAAFFSNVKVQFGQKWEGDQAVTAKLEAGTYTVSVSVAAAEGKTLTDEQRAQSIDTCATSLVAVTYDLDGGSWIPGADGKPQAAVDALVTLAQAGDAMTAITANAEAAKGADVLKTPSETQSFDYWTLNGVKLGSTAAPATVPAGGLTVKAVWKADKIDAPVVTFTAAGNDFKMTATAENATVKYADTKTGTYYTLPADGLTVKGASIWVKAVSADGTKESASVEYQSSADAVSKLGTFADAIAVAETSTSAKNKPVRFGDTLKTLKKDAEDAAKAKGYQKAADWASFIAAEELGMLKKAAEIESANLDAMKSLVKSTDGKTYSYLSDTAYKTAKTAVDAVSAAFEANNDKDAKNDIAKVNGISISDKALAPEYISALAAAMTAAGNAKSAVEAADAEAAIAVNDAIAALPAEVTAANAKEAKSAAEAVIKAYGELSATAKSLVSSADYAKATETIKAADAAVKAADKAAAKKVKGKTVKAKAKKTTKASLKVVKSKSGAKSTFKKVKGTKKVTVSKTGKITVNKGLKAGKKYTVKVKATVGASTKTVNVIVKVK